jgi:hypothetical protein
MTKFPCFVGKGVATFGNQSTKRKASDYKSAYRSYEQLLKDHYISSSGMSWLSAPHQSIPVVMKFLTELFCLPLISLKKMDVYGRNIA